MLISSLSIGEQAERGVTVFRPLIAALAAAILLSLTPSTHAQEPTPTAVPLLGDVNCDGDVNTVDAALILQLDLGIDLSSLRSLCLAAADTNDDGNVDTIDASLVLQLVRGLIDGLPPVPPVPLPPPASGAVSIGSAEIQFGSITSLSLEAHDVTSPGLGAWSINLEYDPTVVSIIECLGGQGAFCNAEYAVGVVRLSHASSGTDDFRGVELAELTFECITVSGMTDLIVNVRTFADATLGAPQAIDPTVTNGSITCVDPPLPTPTQAPPPASGELTIGSAEGAPGQPSTVSVEARGIAAPGLGAWTIDVQYNTAVVSLVDCRAEFGAVCNEEFADGTLRVTGASAGGLEGTSELASLTFQCLAAEGVSDLAITVRTFADATIGAPQPIIPTVMSGSITCAEAPLPTPRPGAGRLNITLIHDLDADGVFDPGEPGLEGWSVDLFPGCIDVFIVLEATDAEGRTTAEAGQNVCVNVRQVGWVLTSGSRLVNVGPGTTVEALYLFRKVGQEYFRLTGNLIVNGLPATDSVLLDAVIGDRSCGDAQIRVGTVRTSYSLYVLSKADRSGCANEGQEFTVTVDGKTVHQASFTSNPRINSELIDLVLGPTPMWFNAFGRDGVPLVPYIGAVTCGEARALFPDYYEIYVFPDALRSG